ncbi:MAG TPA: formate dehydrogenase subunit delta [Acetobacteraceae bacterium]|nr:formate dehydrogenase subunit delta [Acetobacteraceae bacterium]
MANQIARAFARQPHEAAVAATANHIRLFWEPRMRATILQHLDDESGADMVPIAREAVTRLRDDHGGLKKATNGKEADVP